MKTIEKHLANIKNSGMSHLKFEMEAQLNRSSYNVRWNCDSCQGKGVEACSICQGTGVIAQRDLFNPDAHAECQGCEGNGGQSCVPCEGRGDMGSFSSTDVCQKFILNEIALKVYGKSLAQLDLEGRHLESNGGGHRGGTALPFINYVLFYYDGSVDSELTITIPVEHGEKAVIINQAFKKLALTASKGNMDTRGAGMHIAVLPEGCEGRYPHSTALNRAGMQNFTKEVTKLLPALYFVGTAGHRSRSMQYRSPKISSGSKYSAIYTHNNTCMEYRVFETCYDKPEAILDYLQVISNCLKFYADPTLKVKTLGKEFGFPSTTEIAHYFSTTEQLRILNATVKYLKPENKTFKQMKKERGLKYTISSLAIKEKSRLSQLRGEYQEYKKHYDFIANRPLSKYEQNQIDWLMLERNMSIDTAEAEVRSGRQGRLEPFSGFLQRNLTKQRFGTKVAV